MKFKVGDKVKVIAKKHGHEFDIGEIVRIEEISDRDYKCSSLEKNELWWMGEDEFVEWKFTKSDLKDGDIVTDREGKKRTVSKGFLADNFGAISLTYFTEDLKDTNGLKEYDIVKVERPTQYETIFERKEEILDETEKIYLESLIKPFKKRVQSIVKHYYMENEHIILFIKGSPNIMLPFFAEGTMYNGMKLNKAYTLKELGL